MFRQILGWIAGGLLILTGAFGGTALAVPNSAANGIRAASATLGSVEKAQYYVDDYYWDGYYWCWYEFGWHGPGWYVCDYGPWVTGYWWGGGFGWHHWRWHGPRLHGAYHHHGRQRPEVYRGRTPSKVSKGTQYPGTKQVYRDHGRPPSTKVSKGTQYPGTKQVYRGSNVARGPVTPRGGGFAPQGARGGGFAPQGARGGGFAPQGARGGGFAPQSPQGGGGRSHH